MDDALAKATEAYRLLNAMTDHRGDGRPTQYVYPPEVRNAAEALMNAIRMCPPPVPDTAFQRRIAEWMPMCFTPEIAADLTERGDRFGEEALELIQAVYAKVGEDFATRAYALVDYVANRPVGEMPQEVGGVMTTLAALCGPANIDMMQAAWDEAARISHPDTMAKIRAKQASKPMGSALPAPVEEPTPVAPEVDVVQLVASLDTDAKALLFCIGKGSGPGGWRQLNKRSAGLASLGRVRPALYEWRPVPGGAHGTGVDVRLTPLGLRAFETEKEANK